MPLDRTYPSGAEDITGSAFMEEMKAEGEAKWARVTDRLVNVAGRNSISAQAAVTISAYVEGMGLLLIPVLTNTGPVTIDIDGVGGTAVVDRDGAALSGGSLVAGRLYQLRRISSAFRIVTGGEGGADAAAAFVAAHTRANNTAGGTATAGSWLTYPLTAVLTNDLSAAGAALSSNQITLPAGTYDVQAAATFFRTGYSRIRLRNTTDGSTVALGAAPARTGTAVDEMSPATLGGRFTIAAQKVFEVQYRVVTTNADDGLGTAANFTEDELFGYVSFISAPKDGGVGDPGLAGVAPGAPLAFSTDTAASDPGTGNVGFNSGTFDDITEIYISAVPVGGGDLDPWIESFGVVLSHRRGILHISDPVDPTIWAQFDVIDVPVDNSGWWTVAVEPRSAGDNGGLFGDTAPLRATFSYTGERGRAFRPDLVVETEAQRDAAVDGDTAVGYAVLVTEPESPLVGPHLFFLVTPLVSPPPEWSIGVPFTVNDTWALDANTILKADVDDVPVPLPVAEDRIVGRKTGGAIEDLPAADVRGIIGIPKQNFSATTDPAASDDGPNGGYSVGSVWTNVTTARVWQCVDASEGAAVWREMSIGPVLTKFTAPGTWTKNVGLKGIKITLQGPGSPGAPIGPGAGQGDGGASGAYSVRFIPAPMIPGPQPITVGAVQPSPSPRVTRFGPASPSPAPITVTAPGAPGSPVSTAAEAGTGGDLHIAGQAGGQSFAAAVPSPIGPQNILRVPGSGASSLLGIGGLNVDGTSAGQPGTGLGSGGSGARGTGPLPGGDAGPGIAMIEEFY